MSSETVVEFKDFKKSFGTKVVHRGVNFSLRRGECLGLLGGSGQGKSVILRSLIGLERPDSGQVLVDGDDITKMNERQLIEVRKKVAYVFQNGALFDSMTVFENLAYPLRAHTKLGEAEIRKRVIDQLAEFGLEGNEATMPANLSGGMQKRVGLARSIILQPKVVLYDEPTAGLDPYNTIRIQEMILGLKKKGVSAIFVTHDMPSAFAVCDRIALLLEGKIAAIGTKKELESGQESGTESKLTRFVNGFEI
ncbi:MAG TPA: ATP-binding cassette domain-containing protein [Bdellovibrionales bacterium]|jgi:phospholipid/cholesterol/gamma-HCH transport system ATP-binding protein|nr:ATP-binding cassette domain-containing protein [Bdellovibrionales bacterium]